jgi:hypothetical protein
MAAQATTEQPQPSQSLPRASASADVARLAREAYASARNTRALLDQVAVLTQALQQTKMHTAVVEASLRAAGVDPAAVLRAAQLATAQFSAGAVRRDRGSLEGRATEKRDGARGSSLDTAAPPSKPTGTPVQVDKAQRDAAVAAAAVTMAAAARRRAKRRRAPPVIMTTTPCEVEMPVAVSPAARLKKRAAAHSEAVVVVPAAQERFVLQPNGMPDYSSLVAELVDRWAKTSRKRGGSVLPAKLRDEVGERTGGNLGESKIKLSTPPRLSFAFPSSSSPSFSLPLPFPAPT